MLLVNVVRVLKFALLARVLLSWIQPHPTHPLGRLLHQATDPLLNPIRRLIPSMGMLDLSPLIAYFALELLQGWLATL